MYRKRMQELEGILLRFRWGLSGLLKTAYRLFLFYLNVKRKSGLGRVDLGVTALVLVMTNPTVLTIVAERLALLRGFFDLLRGI